MTKPSSVIRKSNSATNCVFPTGPRARGVSTLRRRIQGALGLLLLSTAVVFDAGAAYPERPILIVVPFAACDGSDIMTRALATAMTSATGHKFVVQNRPGAGGNIAAAAVARAPGDGYTLILISAATHGVNPFLYKDAGFDPIKDFTPIAMIGNSAPVLFANASVPASNLQELIALVKANPGKYSYGSPGTGTHHHLGMEQLKLKAGLDLVHVPYKGAGPAMVDLVAGRLPLMMGGFGPAAPYLAQGKIRAIAAANLKRLPSVSQLPVFGEVVPGVGVDGWVGLAGPAGVPAEAVRTLTDALVKSLKDEALRKTYTKIGVDIEYQPPDAFARTIAAQLPMWKELVEASGVKAD